MPELVTAGAGRARRGRPDAAAAAGAHAAAWRGGRPLKRWRYVGVFGAEVMLCAAVARDRPGCRSRGGRCGTASSARWSSSTAAPPARASPSTGRRVRRRRPGRARRSRSATRRRASRSSRRTAAQYIWTRKQGGVRRARDADARRPRGSTIDALGIVDDSAGYHARRTAWWWSAGVGAAAARARRSRGTSSTASTTRRPPPSAPCGSTASRTRSGRCASPRPRRAGFGEGGRCASPPEADRAPARAACCVVASDYEQPFGTFSGALPGAGRAARRAAGVMERHDVRW